MLPQNALLANVNQARSFGDFLQVFRNSATGGYFALLADGSVESLAPGSVPADGSMGPPLTTAPLVWTTTGIVTGVITAGTPFDILAEFTNTGATTLAIGGQPAAAIIHPDGSALVAGDIVAGQEILIVTSAAGHVFAGVSTGNGTYRSRQTLTSVQILALNTTPIITIPNIVVPGAGIITSTVVDSLLAFNNFGGVAYAFGVASVLTLQYITSNNAVDLSLTDTWGEAVADTLEIAGSTAGGGSTTPAAGEGVEATITVADPTLGTGVFELETEFSFSTFTT